MRKWYATFAALALVQVNDPVRDDERDDDGDGEDVINREQALVVGLNQRLVIPVDRVLVRQRHKHQRREVREHRLKVVIAPAPRKRVTAVIPGSFSLGPRPRQNPVLLVASLSCMASMARAASCAGVVLDAGAVTRNTAVRLCVLTASSGGSSELSPALARKARSLGSASTSSSRIASPSLCLSPSIDMASSTDTGEKVPSRDRAVDDSPRRVPRRHHLLLGLGAMGYAVNALFRLASTSTHAIPHGDCSANAAPGSGRRMDTATNDGSRSASAERMRLVNASKPAIDARASSEESSPLRVSRPVAKVEAGFVVVG